MDQDTTPDTQNEAVAATEDPTWALAAADEERARDKALLEFVQGWSLNRAVGLNHRVRELEAEAQRLRAHVDALQGRLDDMLVQRDDAENGPAPDTLTP